MMEMKEKDRTAARLLRVLWLELHDCSCSAADGG